MNKLWGILFFVLPLLGITYSLWRTWHILPLNNLWKWIVIAVMLACILIFFLNFAVFNIDRWPMPAATASYEVGNSALFILLYLVMLYLVIDLGRLVRLIPRSFVEHSLAGTLTVAGIMVAVFTYGYFHYMHKTRQPIEMPTAKRLTRPMKIVMLSDLHLGYHNRVGELNRWVDLVNGEHPDLILICGDIIDGHMRPLLTEHMAEAFHRLQAPVVACLGNHEYYSGIDDAVRFYHDAGITLLRDSAITLNGINIVGRDDRTNRQRKSLKALTDSLDKSLYTILLDHQPYHLEEAEQAGVDFQLSGHTHYGQVWPISWVEDAIYEDAWGPLKKGRTQYFVTSGMGIWGGKFRIGTRSEYLVGMLKSEKK